TMLRLQAIIGNSLGRQPPGCALEPQWCRMLWRFETPARPSPQGPRGGGSPAGRHRLSREREELVRNGLGCGASVPWFVVVDAPLSARTRRRRHTSSEQKETAAVPT